MYKKLRPRFLMLAFSMLSVVVLLLAACGGPATPSTSSSSASVHGGTWTDDLYEEPNSLITNASSETFSNIVDQTLYAPLFYGDAQGQIHPGIVTELPTTANNGISADLKTWTFHLRPGLKWSDGQPLDARDVDFSWRLWTNAKFPADTTIGFNLITSTTLSPDNLSITFHLKQAFSPFLSIWTDSLFAPLPAHVFSAMAPDKILTSADNLNPSVTSGPFKMSESKPGDHYTVVKNPNYYQAAQGLPYLNSIVFRVVTDQDTILKDLQAGSINSSWFLDVTKVPAYKALTNYTLSANPDSSNFEAMYFDFHNPILGTDVNVRKAIAMAIDHNALITTARRGEAVALCTDHGKAYVPGYQANAPCPAFDPTAAKAVLTSDGWKAGSDGVMAKNGQRLEFKYSTTANNFWRADDQLVLQSDLQAIGVKLDIQNYPASTFFGSFLTGGKPGTFDIAEFEDNLGYDPDDAALLACNQIPPSGFNITFYCNHQLDNLYTQEQSTADTNARQTIFNSIHQIYLTQFPFVTLYSPVDIAMSKNVVHNYTPGPNGAQEDNEVWLWWCTGGTC